MNNTTKKEVNTYDRILCVLCALSVASLFVLCAIHPIYASADDVVPYSDIASTIRAYEQRAKSDMDAIQEAIQTDIDNGNVDASSALGREYLNAIAFQYLALNNPSMVTLYNAADYASTEAQQWIDWYNSHQTFNISGSGASGFYRSYKDQKIHIVNYVSPSRFSKTPVFSIPVFTSDEFTVTFTALSPNWSWTISPYYYANDSRYGINIEVPMYQGMYARPSYTFSEPSGYFNTYTMNSTNISYNEPKFLNIGGNSIPTLSANLISSNMPYNSNTYIGGLGSYQQIPTATVDTSEPWSYYNNTILPYIHQNYPNVPDTYLIFPQGYAPAQDPTEPPLFPFTQPWENFVYKQTDTSISVINPTATNDSGTTYTETTIVTVPVTETSTSYVPVYGFNVPLLPNLETVTATLPAETVPPETAQKITDLWAFVKWILDESGMFPIFLALVSIGFVMFIIRFIGG